MSARRIHHRRVDDSKFLSDMAGIGSGSELKMDQELIGGIAQAHAQGHLLQLGSTASQMASHTDPGEFLASISAKINRDIFRIHDDT